jgi:SNF2 family DNA or RNA helicase
MSGIVHIKVRQLNRTPVFVLTHDTYGVDFSAIFGATKLPGDPLHWYYPAYHPVHRLVVDDMHAVSRQMEFDLSFSEAAAKHIDTMNQYADHIEQARLPRDFQFKTPPYQHQLDGLVHLIYNLRASLFYGCGLGKTKIVIDWQRAVGCWPLIVCPRIAVHVWGKELATHGIDQEYRLVDGASKKKKLSQIAEAKDWHGMVITYDTLRLYYEDVAAQVPFDAIVADESQKIKQSRSQRTKAALEMSKGAYRRVIMSGTPSLGDPRDVYPQYRFLAPYFMPWNPFHFKRTFCVVASHNNKIVTGFKNLDIINRRVNLVAIRRKKDECTDLPERTFQDIEVTMRPSQRKLYNQLAKSAVESCGGDLEALVNALVNTSVSLGLAKGGDKVINVPHAAALVNKLIQVSAGFVIKETIPDKDPCLGCAFLKKCVSAEPPVKPWSPRCVKDIEELGPPPERFAERLDGGKAQDLADLLDDLLQAPENKVIIWGQYVEEMNIIEDVVAAKNVGYVRVDGSNTSHARKFESRFNDDPGCRVYVGQVATGVSITLNSAQYMVYFSLPWNLEHYLQSLDRNHRLGQSKNVTVYRMLCKGVDRCIAKALGVKAVVADALIDKEASCRKVNRPITKVQEI